MLAMKEQLHDGLKFRLGIRFSGPYFPIFTLNGRSLTNQSLGLMAGGCAARGSHAGRSWRRAVHAARRPHPLHLHAGAQSEASHVAYFTLHILHFTCFSRLESSEHRSILELWQSVSSTRVK